MTRDALVGAVVGELPGGELPAVVGAEHVQLAPHTFSASACVRLMASAVADLVVSSDTHMKRVASSTRSRKKRRPPSVAGDTGPHKSPCPSSSCFCARYLA